MGFRLLSHGATDVGLRRQKNEDYFCILEDEELYVLADGMGGHASGQVASRLAVEHIVQYITEEIHQPGFQWHFPVPPGASREEAALLNAIQYANERVFIESMKDSRLEGMGTTVCCILGRKDDLVVAHVGDSRIYRYRDGRLEQITRDHSLLNHYLDIGTLEPEEAAGFKNKNVIVRAVGLKDYVDPEVQVTPKRDGDVFLICSDGLSDLVDDWIIKNAIEGDEENLEGVTEKLIRLANQSGGKDNITVVMLAVYEVLDEDQDTDPLGVPAADDTPTRVSGREVFGATPGTPEASRGLRPDQATLPTPLDQRPTLRDLADPNTPTPRQGVPLAHEDPRQRR